MAREESSERAQGAQQKPSAFSYLRTPVVADPIAQREANLLFSVLRAQAAGLLSLAVMTFLLWLSTPLPEVLVTISVLLASSTPIFFAMWVSHRKKLKWGSYLAIFTAVVSTASTTLLFGGLRSSVALTMVFGPLVASILRGRRTMLAVAAIVLVQIAAIGVLESIGVAPLASRIDLDGSIAPSVVTTAGTLTLFIAVMFIYSREFERANAAELEAGRRAVESEKQMADLVRESPDGIAVVGPDGTLLSINAAMERMSGYSAEELVGKHLLQAPGAPDPETRAELEKGLEQMGRDPSLSELTMVRKDGTPYVVETNPRALTLADGTPVMQVVIRDVTERVEAEKKQRSLELDLQDARRMEGLGRLAGGLAHDLRNMLTPILMNVDGLREEPGLSKTAYQMVDVIEASGERASDLLNQIMTFAKRQEIDVAVLDVNEEMRSLEAMLRRLTPSDIEMVFELGDGVRPIRADRGQLSQVVVNLVANARDAMPAGGRLTLRTHNVELTEEAAGDHLHLSSGPYTCLTITDTGEGMSEEVRAHVFDPFFTTKGAKEGVGLGLATVHGIITQSGGAIQVHSTPGQGASFQIHLPSVSSADLGDPNEVPRGAIEPQSDRPLQLLVVDDEEMVRATVVLALQRAGMTVLQASSAAEALALAKELKGDIDLLVTDVVMPEMSGPELARELARTRPKMAVLFVSGYTGAGESRALDEGSVLLSKPFKPSALLSKVREVLAKHESAGDVRNTAS